MSGIPTPEELQALGIAPPQQAAPTQPLNNIPSPQELQALGITPPTQDPSLMQKLGAGAQAAGAEINNLGGSAMNNLGKLVGSEGLQEFAQPHLQAGKDWMAQAEATSPTAATIGKYGTDIAALIAMPSATLPRLAASGALGSFITSEKDTPEGLAVDTAIGGVAALTLGYAMDKIPGLLAKTKDMGVVKAAENVWKGAGAWMLNNPSKYADEAFAATMKKVGGDITKATPDDIVESIITQGNLLKSQGNDLYNFRNALADSAKITVKKDNVAALKASLESDMLTGAPEGTVEALAAAKRLIGQSGGDVSFTKAEELTSGLMGAMHDASVSGNSVLARRLGMVKDAFDDDIAQATLKNPEVLQAHNVATDFYRTVVAPLTDLNTQKQIANKITEDKFVVQLVNRLGKQQTETKAFMAMPEQLQKQVLTAHQMSLKNASTLDGELNLAKYAAGLDKSMKDNPLLYKTTDTLEQMSTLSKVIGAVGVAQKGAGELAKTGGLVGLIPTGGFSLAAPAISKARHLYAAGKMLNNKAAQGLLRTMKGLEAYPESAMAKQTAKKIGLSYTNQLTNISIRHKVAGMFSPEQSEDRGTVSGSPEGMRG